RSALQFKGGIENAWERLNQYFWDREGLSTYKNTRNGLLGEDYSSKFSPWLAKGCISSRQIYWEVKRYESEVTSNQSTYWLIFELIWRDYFRFVSMKYGDRIFWPSGIKATPPPSRQHQRTFEHWINGTTKDDFVNANMIELKETGWMSNRGRQNVASYLVHDLNIDWRMGAAWFENRLLDYDPASNYGNWIYVAGVGNDPRPNRKFNTKRQAEMYDSKGEFVKHWLS
ncbi:MAG: DASH family cryptochrome, partial [Flavobacteriales bacterium]|nr:DASH family cryptochrome [Flavobacteriales bacterium]